LCRSNYLITLLKSLIDAELLLQIFGVFAFKKLMITEKQFLDALDIVKKYQKQIDLLVNKVEKQNNLPLELFLYNYKIGKYDFKISRRLYLLLCQLNVFKHIHNYTLINMQDFKRENFLKVKGVGHGTWCELNEILEKLNIKL